MILARYGKAPIAIGFALVLLLGSAVPLAWFYWDDLAADDSKFIGSEDLTRFLQPERTGAPLVLALGDSTLRPPISFSSQVAKRLGDIVEIRTLSVLGLSQAEAALLVARALELQPDGLVLLAHFAMFEVSRPLRLRQLPFLVPIPRLPDLLRLPFYTRGLGAGELVLSSLAGALLPELLPEIRRTSVRRLDHALWSRFAVAAGSPEYRAARWEQQRREAIARNLRPFYAGHPTFEMIRGSVRMAERTGVETLVVVSPVNVAAVQSVAPFDGEAFAAAVRDLRAVVEAEGGDLIDMHRSLPPNNFTDALGHYGVIGANRISVPVEDWIRRILRFPTREERDRSMASPGEEAR